MTINVAITFDRIAAIKRAIEALEYEQQEYKGVGTYPTRRDFEIEAAVAALEEMLKEAGVKDAT